MKKEKLGYESAELKIVLLSALDIVTVSDPTGDIIEEGDSSWA